MNDDAAHHNMRLLHNQATLSFCASEKKCYAAQVMMQETTSLTLTVPDLTEALTYFTERLQFRLEMIVPADAPERVVLFGQSALGAWERALQAVYPTQSGSSAQ